MLLTSVFLVFLSLYFWSMFNLVRTISRIEEAKNWIKLSAKVKESKLINKEQFLLLPTKKTSDFFCTYSIGDKDFGLTRVSLYPSTTAQERIKIKSIKPGDVVDIFVDKKNPHVGVLIPPGEHRIVLLSIKMIFSICLTIVAGIICFSK